MGTIFLGLVVVFVLGMVCGYIFKEAIIKNKRR
jgi:hypothetical protein